jgi:dienelactone hydrolase
MHVILVTDIYGLTPAVDELVQRLTANDKQVSVVEPYSKQYRQFINEDMAYEAFIKACGHEQYADNLKDLIKGYQQQVVIIAFSAGASAAWIVTAELNNIKHLIGFYPSQIRHHLHLVPSCPVSFVFPQYEDFFNVQDVIATLETHQQVSCFSVPFLHGFINPYSKHYHQEAAQCFSLLLAQDEVISDVSNFRSLVNKLADL